MALFGKEYERVIYERRIAAWKLSIEKKRLELCAGLNVDKKRLESYAGLNMPLSPGKKPQPARPQTGLLTVKVPRSHYIFMTGLLTIKVP